MFFGGNTNVGNVYAKVDVAGNGVSDGNQLVKHYVYDQRGLLLLTVDGRGSVTNPTQPNTAYATTYTYDGLGRVLSATQWIDSTHTRTATSQYDDAGNKVITTAANGLVTTQIFDKNGHLVTQSQTQGSTVFGTTSYQYDADGRARITTDPTGLKTHILYDEAGRKVADIDATGALTEYVYNDNSQVAKTIHYANRLSAAQMASLIDAGGDPANVTLRLCPSGARPRSRHRPADQPRHLGGPKFQAMAGF